jgi:predicted DNA binding CopG/RHH family protein
MEMAQFLESLETDLDRIAAVGDDAVSQAAGRLNQALRASAGMRLLDALGVAAVEISAQLPAGHVEVRMSGQDPNLVYVEEEQAAAQAPTEDETSARITLRLPEGLKGQVEAAASREGISVNAWIVRALGHTVHAPQHRGPRIGSRLTGFAKS